MQTQYIHNHVHNSIIPNPFHMPLAAQMEIGQEYESFERDGCMLPFLEVKYDAWIQYSESNSLSHI